MTPNSMIMMQHKIRQNAMNTREYVADLKRWEDDIKRKERKRSERKHKTSSSARAKKNGPGVRKSSTAKVRSIPPVRGSVGTTTLTHTHMGSSENTPKCHDPRLGGLVPRNFSARVSKSKPGKGGGSAAAHTYDKGYKKWESFDVEKALSEVDNETEAMVISNESEEVDARTCGADNVDNSASSSVDSGARSSSKETTRSAEALNDKHAMNRGDAERDRGNTHFKRGEFTEAIKCYTRAIALNAQSAAAYCNRGFCHLKLQDYRRAIEDCTSALTIDSTNVKALLRRAKASNGLGRHKSALRDLVAAHQIRPKTKTIKREIVKTREFVRSSARRAPRTRLRVVSASDLSLPVFGPSGERKSPPTSSSIVIEEVESSAASVSADAIVAPAKKDADLVRNSDLLDQEETVQRRPFSAPPSSSRAKISVSALPKTAYEFGRMWKTIRHDASLQDRLLKRLTSDRVKKIFKNSIESDQFMSIVRVLRQFCDTWDAQKLFEVMRAFSKIKRFEMLTMFLSSRNMPQNEHIELHQKRHGRRMDFHERVRKREARMVHKRAKFAQKVHGLRAKLFQKKRYKEKAAMRKTIKQHKERDNTHTNKDAKPEGALPSYLLDRENVSRAKVLSNTIKQKRREKAGKW
eukprot:g2151.t1